MCAVNTKLNTKHIQELRRRTGAGMLQCQTTLQSVRGDVELAVEQLRRQGMNAPETRISRRTADGVIGSYIHHNGKLGVLVEVNCETDFVARTGAFTTLVRQLAEHIAGAAPLAVSREALAPELVERKRQMFEDDVRVANTAPDLAVKILAGKMEAYYRAVVLMDQAWVREPTVTIAHLVADVSAKTGEQVQVRRFARFHMGIA